LGAIILQQLTPTGCR